MESVSPEQPGVPAAVPQVCSSTVYSMCPLTYVLTCGTCTEPNSCGKQLTSVTPHPPGLLHATMQAPTTNISSGTPKLLCAGIEHTIPADPKLRTHLLEQLCTEHGGNHKVLARYIASPVPRSYHRFRIGAALADCIQHRHLFGPEGNLHCVPPSVV